LLIENSVNFLKTFGLCLVLVTLVAVLALPHWPWENESIGEMRTLATRSQVNILSAPVSIVYSMIESAVLLAVEPSLDPELLETEAYWQTPEDRI
jgi:hypothetical protein